MNFKTIYRTATGWSMLLLLNLVFSLNAISGVLADEASGKVRVACVGNSVTRGYGLAAPEKDSYPARLQKLLGEGFDVRNFGHSGATLLSKGHRPYTGTQEYKDALACNADIIVIHLGLNDTDPRNWPEYRDDFIADYMHLVASFVEGREPSPNVFICRMSPIFHGHPRFKSGTRDWFRQIQNAIEQVADNCNAGLIDLHDPLYERPDLFKDALHPDEEGAEIIARTVYENITGNFGGLMLAPIFMDHMVLQQGANHPVWGRANAGDTITATFNGQSETTVADDSGKWRLHFESADAGGPYRIEVSGSRNESVVIDDILVGEVWICAGQSNMEFQLMHAANSSSLTEKASDRNIRMLNMKGIVRPDDVAWESDALKQLNQLDFFEGEWKTNNAGEASAFSAIGYSFGARLSEELDVPVGLINISVGGAPVEAFIDRKNLESDPWMIDVLYDWKHNDFIQKWCRERAAKNLSLSSNPLQRHPFEPAYIYEAGLKSLQNLPVAGVIWYQGESNAHNAEHYRHAFPLLVKSWREAFSQPALPFYFAQLSSINRPSWPYFRDVQRQLSLEVTNSGMVVTSDLGDYLDVHPKRKIEVGERFAGLVLSDKYQILGMHESSPEVGAVVYDQGNVVVYFATTTNLRTSDGSALKELEIAGPDGLFTPAKSIIKGNRIIIDADTTPVKKVRYGWKPFSRGNLINENGLPVSTFLIEVTAGSDD